MANEYYTRADAFKVLRGRGFFRFHTDQQLRSMVRAYARFYAPTWIEPVGTRYKTRRGRIWARWQGSDIPAGYVARPYFNDWDMFSVASTCLICAGCSRPAKFHDWRGCDGWQTPAPLCWDCRSAVQEFVNEASPAISAARGTVQAVYAAISGE